jgi:PIN domain nuclease of toxin-antitoxin system
VITLLLDTHVVYWLAVEPDRVSALASQEIDAADELAVASITWYELARLVERGRVDAGMPLLRWLQGLASGVRSVGLTPSIATHASRLPAAFLGDPSDRIIIATGIEHGWRIVSKDRRMHEHAALTAGVIW